MDNRKSGVLIPCDDLTLSIDWARHGDWTWAGVMNRKFDLIDMWKIPHVRYEEQIELIVEGFKMPRKWLRIVDGKEIESFMYFDRITTVRGDSTGIGDFPMEFLRDQSGLPMDDESQVQFTMHSKNDIFTLLDAALFPEKSDPERFSYPADRPLTAELEEQMTILVREYVGEGEYLSPHAPKDGHDAHDDACMMLALGAMGAAGGKIGSILVG